MALGISVTNKKIKVPTLITEKGGVIYSDYDKQGTITSFNLKTNINAPIIGNNKTFVLGDKVKIEVNDSLKEIFKKDPSKIHLPVANLPVKKAESIILIQILIQKPLHFAKGKHQIATEISELKEGMYLIVIQTNSGDLIS